jgi:hypothetical protein
MATYEHGISGPFTGKVGSVIGSSWKDKNYIKSLPNTRKHPKPSVKQQVQQNKFDLMGSFMKCMKDVVKLGFDDKVKKLSAFNKAMSYAAKNALDTTTTPYRIRYSDVLLTKGQHPNADDLTATPGNPGEILFSWTDNTGQSGARADDKAVLIAYSPSQDRVTYTYKTATRSAGTATLKVDQYKGQKLETYVTFLKADGSDVSTSVYTGEITVTA